MGRKPTVGSGWIADVARIPVEARPHTKHAARNSGIFDTVGFMRSMMECLSKAAEMDAFAACCPTREERTMFLSLGFRWRQLAVRALRHDQGTSEHRLTQISNR